jgi:hypothetical protein
MDFSITSYELQVMKSGFHFVSAETREQSVQWMHTHSPKRRKSLNKRLPDINLMASVFWERKGVLMD